MLGEVKEFAQGPRLGGGAWSGQTQIRAALHRPPAGKPRTRVSISPDLGSRSTRLVYSFKSCEGRAMGNGKMLG